MRRELVLPRAFVALKSSVMRVAARPRRIDAHYRTFPRRLLARATRDVSDGAARGIRSALDAIIRGMPQPQTHTRPTVMAVWLIIAGVDRLVGGVLAHDGAAAPARRTPTRSPRATSARWCSARRTSSPGRAACSASRTRSSGSPAGSRPIVVGVAILAGARFARWFWWLFELGMTFAFVFVIWLIGQSIFVLGTLCPWCMVTWVVTIPTYYVVTHPRAAIRHRPGAATASAAARTR